MKNPNRRRLAKWKRITISVCVAISLFDTNMIADESMTKPTIESVLPVSGGLDWMADGIGKDGRAYVDYIVQPSMRGVVYLSPKLFASKELEEKNMRPELIYLFEKKMVNSTLINLLSSQNTESQMKDFVKLAIGAGNIIFSYDYYDEERQKVGPEELKFLAERKPALYKSLVTRDPIWYVIQKEDGTAFSLELSRARGAPTSFVNLCCPPRMLDIGNIPKEIQEKVRAIANDHPSGCSNDFLGMPLCGKEDFGKLAMRFLKTGNLFSVSVRSPVNIQFDKTVKMTSSEADFFFNKGKFYGLYLLIKPSGNPEEMARRFVTYLEKDSSIKQKNYPDGPVVLGERKIKAGQRLITLAWKLWPHSIELALFSSEEIPEPEKLEQVIDPDNLAPKERAILLNRRINNLTEKIKNMTHNNKYHSSKAGRDLLIYSYSMRAIYYYMIEAYEKASSDVEACQNLGGSVDDKFLKSLEMALKHKINVAQ